MRPLAPALLGVLLLALPAPAGALLAPAPCPVPDFIPGTTLEAAPGGSWLKLTLAVASPVKGTFWSVVASRVSTLNAATGGFYGYFAERAVVGGFVHDAQGQERMRGGLGLYPYGVHLDLPDTSLRVAAGDLGCGGAAAGASLTLEPGTYTAVVLGATETGSGHGLALPPGVVVQARELGPLTVLHEAAYDCVANARVEAAGASAQALVDCSTAYAAAHPVYRALFVGRFPDAAHEVRWARPDGTTSAPIVFADLGRGPAGTWTLEIPQYVTPLGQPFAAPGPFDGDLGVFGAFAAVP